MADPTAQSASEVVITDTRHVSLAVNDEDLLSLGTQQALAAIAQPMSYLLVAFLFFGALRKPERRRLADPAGKLLPATSALPPAAELWRQVKTRLFPNSAAVDDVPSASTTSTASTEET